MLIIRNKQLKALEVLRPQTFRPKMVQHLGNHFPRLAAMCGWDGLMEIVDDGLSRVKEFGLKTSFEAASFIDLTVILGRGFDTDPLLPWVREILGGQAGDVNSRLKQLRKAAAKFHGRIVKPGELYPVAAYRQIIDTEYDDLEDSIKILSAEEFPGYLKQLWPEKFDLIDEAGLGSFMETGTQKANKYGLSSTAGIFYYCMLMFLLGHDFDRDLQYAWIGDTLNDPAYDEEYYKLCSLHFITQKYFEAMLEVSFTENL